MKREKPAAAGTLIPSWATKELAEQDAKRAAARAAGNEEDRGASFRQNFVKKIAYEFELSHKWGAQADTSDLGYGEEVLVPIRQKYPVRVRGRFETWLTSWMNRVGAPVFNFPPCANLRGFIFNEGGRGLTFTSINGCPFRLYVAGLVLSYARTWVKGKPGPWKWSLRRFR